MNQYAHTSTINHLDENESKWFAVCTRYKCEKYVHKHLKKKGIEAYLPLLKTVKQYSSKKKVIQKPLINCYVFVRIRSREYVQVLQTEYVQYFLKQGKDLLSIPDSEMEILERVVGANVDFEIDPMDFNPGQKVEIIAGSLTGLQGVLAEIKGKKEFIIELSNITYQFKIHIDPKLISTIA